MKKFSKLKLETFIWAVILTLLVAVVVGFIGLEIFVWIVYGGKPVEEIPFWALWLMFFNGN